MAFSLFSFMGTKFHHYIFPGAFYRHGDALLRVARRYPDVRVEPEENVAPMVPAGAPLNDMIDGE